MIGEFQLIELIIDIVLLALLVLTAGAIVRTRDLFSAVMLAGIYGLLSASFFVLMDAVDVAFTEAAVGAGIAPLLMFTTLAMTGRYQKREGNVPAISILIILLGALLLLTTLDFPPFSSPDSPVHTYLTPRYLNQSPMEIGIPNVVTSVLASYRAFDTLGEVAVIFTAGVGVLSVLAMRLRRLPQVSSSLHEHKVLRIVGKIFIPPIMLFALYVQFHGEYGPGGGFQAGVIFAAGLVLYAMIFGMSVTKRVINHGAIRFLAAVGLLLYGVIGVLGILTGGNFLDYNHLAGDPVTGQHLGILLIELGVGVSVAAVMLLIYFSFAEYKQMDNE